MTSSPLTLSPDDIALRMAPGAPDHHRFFAFAVVEGGCLLRRRPTFSLMGKHYRTPRMAYMVSARRWDLPKRIGVSTTCGRSRCIAPEHLQAQEMTHHLRGMSSGRPPLISGELAQEIYDRRASGDSATAVADDLGVSKSSVCSIWSGRTRRGDIERWAHPDAGEQAEEPPAPEMAPPIEYPIVGASRSCQRCPTGYMADDDDPGERVCLMCGHRDYNGRRSEGEMRLISDMQHEAELFREESDARRMNHYIWDANPPA